MGEQGLLLRIFINETAHVGSKPLFEYILHQAKDQGLAGATVFRGIAGFQAGHPIRHQSILRLSDELPMVIEIVDTEKKIKSFIELIEPQVDDGLMTTESVTIVKSVNKEGNNA